MICAVLLGPNYGVAVAFIASLLRNLFGLGTIMAFQEHDWCLYVASSLAKQRIFFH